MIIGQWMKRTHNQVSKGFIWLFMQPSRENFCISEKKNISIDSTTDKRYGNLPLKFQKQLNECSMICTPGSSSDYSAIKQTTSVLYFARSTHAFILVDTRNIGSDQQKDLNNLSTSFWKLILSISVRWCNPFLVKV